jgi:hypothetical protein
MSPRPSYLTLVKLACGAARGELVAVRPSVLDELERRDGAGFRRWLAAVPAPAATPPGTWSPVPAHDGGV